MRTAPGGRDDWRLFVAAYPPGPVAVELLGAARRVVETDGRFTPAEQVHLTLAFIGDTRVRDLERVRESVARSASGVGALTLRPSRLLTLPEGGRGRLIAAETDAPAGLMEVQRRLAHRLARRPRKEAGDRFRPHMTLFRAARGVECPRVDEPLDVAPFEVGSVVLMRSVLRAGGAAHAEVARFPLS